MNALLIEKYDHDLNKLKKSYQQKLQDDFQTNTESTNIRVLKLEMHWHDSDQIWVGSIKFSSKNPASNKDFYEARKDGYSKGVFQKFGFDYDDVALIKIMTDEFYKNDHIYGEILGQGVTSLKSNKKNQLKLSF